ncbi:MAG: radical SAM protein [Anaerolineae bacterium]|nr:radical SAM protein [Anaerolineae bacterium]
MPDTNTLLEAAETFTPLRAGDLPIFRQDGGVYTLFYAPGCLCVIERHHAARLEAAITSPGGADQAGAHWGTALRTHAERAVTEAERRLSEPFAPECLTLYLNNECNLACVYCYADPAPRPAARLQPDAIAAAAEIVAAHCRAKGLPFTAVFHGGGEPTLHRADVERALTLIERAAAASDVPLFRYVATNGVMSAQKAAWLAGSFDLVGLSCDGTPDIQDRQRPRRGGGSTSAAIERTAEQLHRADRPFHVRATITAATLHRQVEIAGYICRKLAPAEIHFEPVYLGGRADAGIGLDVEQAEAYVRHFFAARDVAHSYGIPLTTSGSRPGAVHGAYCNVYRHVLNLVPPGAATACFKITGEAQAQQAGVCIGTLNRQTGRFVIDHERITALRRRLDRMPARCVNCFNRYHCVHECPDICPLGDAPPGSEPGFRCRMQKALAYALLQEKAGALWAAAQAGTIAHDETGAYGTTAF